MAALTEAKRRANNKYIKEHMTVLGCKIRKDKADIFRAACLTAGTTPNAVFREAIDRFLVDHQEQAENADPPQTEGGNTQK